MQMRQIDLTQRKCKSENIFSIKKIQIAMKLLLNTLRRFKVTSLLNSSILLMIERITALRAELIH